MKKKVVGFCKIVPSSCGISFQGIYLAHIRHCILSDRKVLILEPLPHSTLKGCDLYIVCQLLGKIPVVAQVQPGETNSGLHWVKSNLSLNIVVLEQIAPATLLDSPDIEWTEDTLYGKVIYGAKAHIVTINTCEAKGITVIKTVFRSTLETLVKQGKVNKDNDGYNTYYKISDPEIVKKIGEQVICKRNVPKRILENAIVIPL